MTDSSSRAGVIFGGVRLGPGSIGDDDYYLGLTSSTAVQMPKQAGRV